MTTNFPLVLDDDTTLPSPTTATALNASGALAHHIQHGNADDAIKAIEAQLGAGSITVPNRYLPGLHASSRGAKADGSTPSAAAINQTIIDAQSDPSHTVWLDAGVYLLETSIVPQSGVALRGAGWDNTILRVAANTNIPGIRGATLVSYALFEDFQVDMNSANQSGAGGDACQFYIDHSVVSRVATRNVVTGHGNSGFTLNNPDTGPGGAPGGILNYVLNCDISGDQYGIFQRYPFYDSWVMGCYVAANDKDVFCEAADVRWYYNHFDGTPNYCIYAGEPSGHVFVGNNIENANVNNVYAWQAPYSADSANTVGCLFSGNTFGIGTTGNVIELLGVDATHHLRGWALTGNIFAYGRAPRAAYILEATNYVDQLVFTGNMVFNAYTNANPIHYDGTCTNVTVSGNSNNGVTTP